MNQSHDRRAPDAARIPFDAMVEVGGALGPTFEAQAVNLSEQGMSLRTAYLPEIGQPVMCRFDTGEGAAVTAAGEVLWQQHLGEGGEFGIRFTNLDAASAGALRRILGVVEDGRAVLDPGRKVRLHIEGLASPMRARIREHGGAGVVTYSDLGFLQMGRPLELEDAASGGRRPALIDRVEVEIDGETRVPQLVVSLRYDDTDGRASAVGPVEALPTRADGEPAHADEAYADEAYDAHDRAAAAYDAAQGYPPRAHADGTYDADQAYDPRGGEPYGAEQAYDPHGGEPYGAEQAYDPHAYADEAYGDPAHAARMYGDPAHADATYGDHADTFDETTYDEPRHAEALEDEPPPAPDAHLRDTEEDASSSDAQDANERAPHALAVRAAQLKSSLARSAKTVTPAVLAFMERTKKTAALLAERARGKASPAEAPARRTTAPPPGGGLHTHGRRIVRARASDDAGAPKKPSSALELAKLGIASLPFEITKRRAMIAGAIGVAALLVVFIAQKPDPAPALEVARDTPEEIVEEIPTTTIATLPAADEEEDEAPAAAAPTPAPPPDRFIAAVKADAPPARPLPFTNGAVGSRPTLIRIKMDGPIERILGASQPTGFTIVIPKRHALEPTEPLASADARVAAIETWNEETGAELNVTFKDGVPNYVVRARGETLELLFARPNLRGTEAPAAKAAPAPAKKRATPAKPAAAPKKSTTSDAKKSTSKKR